MKALIKQNATGKLKPYAGQWVDIDEENVFNNQYNTTDQYGNLRIFDSDIQKMRDDIRPNIVVCGYCGKHIPIGEEEQHFLEKEKNSCDKNVLNLDCSYCMARPISDSKTVKESDIKDNKFTKTTTQEYEYVCTFNEYDRHIHKTQDETSTINCTYMMHRKLGVKAFTPENTFFLQYPDNIPIYYVDTAHLPGEWEANDWKDRIKYNKHMESFRLEAQLRCDKKDDRDIVYFILHNARTTIRFTYDPELKLFTIYDGINSSPRCAKTLLKDATNVAAKVNNMIAPIIQQIMIKR